MEEVVRLQKNLKRVSVIDQNELVLCEIDREEACRLVRDEQAVIVQGCSIRLVTRAGDVRAVRAGSGECGPMAAAVMRKLTPDAEWIDYGRRTG